MMPGGSGPVVVTVAAGPVVEVVEVVDDEVGGVVRGAVSAVAAVGGAVGSVPLPPVSSAHAATRSAAVTANVKALLCVIATSTVAIR